MSVAKGLIQKLLGGELLCKNYHSTIVFIRVVGTNTFNMRIFNLKKSKNE